MGGRARQHCSMGLRFGSVYMERYEDLIGLQPLLSRSSKSLEKQSKRGCSNCSYHFIWDKWFLSFLWKDLRMDETSHQVLLDRCTTQITDVGPYLVRWKLYWCGVRHFGDNTNMPPPVAGNLWRTNVTAIIHEKSDIVNWDSKQRRKNIDVIEGLAIFTAYGY